MIQIVCNYYYSQFLCISVISKYDKILAQLWRLDKDMKLVNKYGGWKYSHNSWNIPDEGQEGHIANQETNEVLTINDKASGK